MPKQEIYDMSFAKVYDLLVAKAERKGCTREEVNEVTRWLTGYEDEDIAAAYIDGWTYGELFSKRSICSVINRMNTLLIRWTLSACTEGPSCTNSKYKY